MNSVVHHSPKRISFEFLVSVAHIRRSLSHENALTALPFQTVHDCLVRRGGRT